jgi:methylenetetrahydrofolate dehydrogenase (NADP+)/methenyltetrahydrofolate cyclohydrolase
MQFFDGNLHAKNLDLRLYELSKQKESELKALYIVQLGDNPSSTKYINLKIKLCNRLGIDAIHKKYPQDIAFSNLASDLASILEATSTGGIIIQLPLPKDVFQNVLNLVPIDKDIDLLSAEAQGRFYNNDFTLLPPVVAAFDYFVRTNNLELKDLSAAVIGNGFLVGAPIAHYLRAQGAAVKLYEEAHNVEDLMFKEDLLVLAAGVPRLIRGKQIKEGGIVVDFGSSVIDRVVVGDLDIYSSLDHLGAISPSPGGMGPLVLRFLLLNFFKLQELYI